MCNSSKIFTFCPENIKAIADEISKCGKIVMKKLEDNLTELV